MNPRLEFKRGCRADRPPSASSIWLSGATAAALALAVAWTASRIDIGVTFPPTGIADRIIRLAPGDFATFLIETFGHNAQRLLAIAVLLLFLGVGALIGATASRFSNSVAWGGVAFGVVLSAAALSAPVGTDTALVLTASVAAGMAYAATLAWLTGVSELAQSDQVGISRRRALGLAGSAAVGFVFAGTLLGRLLPPRTGREGLALATPPRPARPPERSAAFPAVPGLSPEVTATAEHYVVDIDLQAPIVNVASWSLEVSGLVDEPLKLGFSDLQEQFGVVEEYSVLTCVSNQVGGPLIGNSKWTGVRLAEVLHVAGVQSGAHDLALICADGYTVSIPLERALEDSAMLAIAQNDEPLTVEHGFPCRLRVPRLYGMMNAKWLERIEVVDSDFQGYWADRGWTDVGTVRTQSRIDTVAPAPLRGEPTWVAGVAWAGDRGVSLVEVSFDGGASWEAATLQAPLSPLAWTRWAHRFVPARAGAQLISCRAVDGEGMIQEDVPRAPHPSGATGYHRVSVGVA